MNCTCLLLSVYEGQKPGGWIECILCVQWLCALLVKSAAYEETQHRRATTLSMFLAALAGKWSFVAQRSKVG